MHNPSLSTTQHREPIEALTFSHAFPHDTLLIERCLGRRLTVDVLSLIPLPPFTNSVIDGFAVRCEDLEGGSPWTPPVVGDILAGDTREDHFEKGRTWRIMTGASVSEGAGTVVKVEHTDHAADITQAPDSVEIRVTPKLSANMRVAGGALRAGSPVLEVGHILDGTTLLAATSVGHSTLTVLPCPCVITVSTGMKLRRAGEALERERVPDSNDILLRGLVEEAGGQVVAYLRMGSTPAGLRRALDEAPEVDLALMASGTSAGAFEAVRLTSGADTDSRHIAQQPDGPQDVGSTQVGAGGRETPVICLPGNPVSVFTTFHMYVAGTLVVMSGLAALEHGGTAPSDVVVRACVSWDCPSGKTQFIPLRFVDIPRDGTGTCWVEPVHPLGPKSHLVASPANAEAIGVVAPGVGMVEPDQELAVTLLMG